MDISDVDIDRILVSDTFAYRKDEAKKDFRYFIGHRNDNIPKPFSILF